MKKIIIRISQLNKTLRSESTLSLLEILNREEVMTYAPCGGKGLCGKCKVKVSGDINSVTDEEKKCLSIEEIKSGIRLACKTYINSEAVVELIESNSANNSKENIKTVKHYKINSKISKTVIKPELSSLKHNFSIAEGISNKLTDKEIDIDFDIFEQLAGTIDCSKELTVTLYGNKLIDIENGNTEKTKYGVAVDIGTTTIACYLIDLSTGNQVGVQSMQNPQAGYGADVISRLNYCIENKDGLKILSKAVKNAVNTVIKKASKKASIDKKNIYECILVGNTAMNHLFLELNPVSLSALPFNPVTKKMVTKNAQSANISSINPNAEVIFLPNIGGFVGSDIIGDMIAADLKNSTENVLLIDLGTNGEIVLSTSKEKLACSTAAGPAFEGARIKNGMQAFSGAINTVGFNGEDIYFTTIDNQKPKGICGSGLIDIVNVFLNAGIISESGSIMDPENITNKKLSDRILVNNKMKEIIIAYENYTEDKTAITITQKDIREIQLSKSAVRSGINILLKLAGITYNEIDKVLLAGAFGNFISKENAQGIGLFPDIPLSKVVSIGNAAGEGAKMVLCNKNLIDKEIENYTSSTRHIELSTHPDFQNEFVDKMYFK